MSRRTDNHHRVATICREATGLPHHVCLRWVAEGVITRRQPVPDAAGNQALQRTTEALIVEELCRGLREEDQRDGALLGFTHARPGPDGLLLGLHPAMADRVLALVLPRLDELYGGLRGVPGLRLVPQGGEWILTQVRGHAVIRLVHPDPVWRPRLPEHAPGLTQLWRRGRRRPHPAEAAELERVRQGGAQDWLNSRVLRRPRLLAAAGAAHGTANVYTHGGGDVVVEWCCAIEPAELEERLRRSGLAVRPPDVEEDPRDRARPPGVIAMGGARVSVRQAPCYAEIVTDGPVD
ncbi:hypothetical protein [Streptomyces sp. NPDC002054]|uniref:hypothetical protein n=1 Tax=Streptomyces sp. NPDC002054 TaxID=3154663 RepID=UPI003319B305